MRMDRLASATLNDVLENPRYYGMPTNFAEMKAFMDRVRPKKDATFASVDRGSNLLGAYVKTQKYFIEGPDGIRYDCGKSLERVQSVAKNMGLNWDELECYPEVIPDAGLKCDINVTFKIKKPKSSLILPGQ